MAPLLHKSGRKAFKPFLVLDLDLTLLHSFRLKDQSVTGSYIEVGISVGGVEMWRRDDDCDCDGGGGGGVDDGDDDHDDHDEAE